MLAKKCQKKMPKNAEKFYCENCDFGCSKESNYTQHLNTLKHKRLTNANKRLIKKCQKMPNEYTCEYCGKQYKHLSSLCKHKKTCSMNVNTIYISDENIQSTSIQKTDSDDNMKSIFNNLVQQNNELHKTLVELVPKIGNNNVTTTNCNNTTNNHFNINMFLNEQCKNAMNLTDFIESLPITAETFEYTNENGLTKSLTNLMIQGLNGMDVLDRPIHCTDPSRKIMYVKENDVWEKDKGQETVIKGIDKLAVKQRTNITKWQEANSGWQTDDNLQTKLTNIVGNLR